MEDGRTFLKVKIKSLAAEAHIIRKEERKNTKVNEFGYNELRQELRLHRIGTVRNEAFFTLLAYGFIRGREFHQIAPGSKPTEIFSWDKVWKMVDKYGVRSWDNQKEPQKKRFEAWKQKAISESGQTAKAESCNLSDAGSTPASRSILEKIVDKVMGA